jgi:serine/threonine protein phosphatase PrpC
LISRKLFGGSFLPSIFDRFFHKKAPAAVQPSLRDDSPSQPKQDAVVEQLPEPAEMEPGLISSPAHLETPQILVGIGQSAGIQRESNEDSLFTLTTNLISTGQTVNFGLYIIADGMGGHENGELASSIAVSRLSTYVINTFFLPSLSSKSQKLDISLHEVMREGVLDAHQAIKQTAFGSGTTLTAALIVGDLITIAHVGDSRAYVIDRHGEMQLLTHDHSLVKRLEEIGQITPQEASVHPRRNLLYRALGQGDLTEPDISSFTINQGLKLMLCTDGLWGVLPEGELQHIITSSSEPQIVCESLIMSANTAGGPDNISVILVQFPG